MAGVLELPVDEIDDDTGPSTTGSWTSLRHVQLVAAVRDEYGVPVTPKEARSCRSVGKLRALLTAKGVTA